MSATQGPSGAVRIEDTVKDFWATRPRRPRRGRKIAGVAAGIGNRYRIDPVLVRVGLAVAAVYGGAGILVYLLGWLFLPEEDDETSPIESLFGKGRSSTSSAFTVLLGIITVPVVGMFFSGSFTGEFSNWVSLLVVGGLLFMLHQTRGHVTPVSSAPAPPTPPPAPTMPMSTPVMPTMPVYSPPPAEPPVAEESRTTPPAWDPLGAAPFAWDLPEPAPPEPEEPEPPVKRRKPRVATATLGIALMTVAGLAIAASETNVGWINPPHVIGVALAIIGLGLVAGAFLRAGRGLIALAVPLSVVGLGMAAISPGGSYHGLGDLTANPINLAQVLPAYERSAGNVQLDLTGMPPEGVVDTRVHADVGNVTVIVPEDADVTLVCENNAGEIDCLGEQRSGTDLAMTAPTSYGDDGEGGLRINLTASVGLGNVEVRRG
ncbi:PspC domain-containing protein [Actinophytocola sp.]|uniref:PspC domain-containing protein n=1 Tax=Actinophytocola sp. TaxID=1872138 RepID=UPI002ED04569